MLPQSYLWLQRTNHCTLNTQGYATNCIFTTGHSPNPSQGEWIATHWAPAHWGLSSAVLTPDPIAFNINQLAHNWCFSAVCWLLFPTAHTFRISSPQRCSQLPRTVCDTKVGSQQRFTISHRCLSAWEHSDISQAASALRYHYVPSLQLLLVFFFFWVYPCHRERWGGFPHSHYPNNILSFALEEKQQHPEAHRAIFSCSVALTPAWLWNSNGLEMHSEYRDANKHTKSLPRILQRDLS